MKIARLKLRATIFVFLLLGLTFLAEYANAQVVTVLSGTITDRSTGAGISGASVILYGPSFYIATTDANGAYSVTGQQWPYTGTATVFIQAHGYYTVQTSVNIASPFPVTFNQTLLAGGAVLQGTLRDASTNQPIANASLGYSGTRTFRWGASTRSASSDVNGNYAFDASEFDESAATNGTAGTLTVNASNYIQSNISVTAIPPFPWVHDFAMTPASGVLLSGTITDRSTGAGISGASVILYGPSFYIATTDANGAYSVTGQQWPYTGTATVFIQAHGYYTVQTSVNIASPFPVTFNQTLLAGGAVLQGTLRDASTNQPIANASLGYSGTRTFRWGASTRSASSDVNGNYAFDASEFDESAATNGTAGTLTVNASNYIQSNISVTAIPPFPWVHDFAMTPASGVLLSGTITDRSTGAGISGASVILYGPSFYIATTDANGAYSVTGQQWPYTGTATVFIQAHGYYTVQTSVNIASPFPVTFNQTLLAGGAVLQGTLRDASTNQPIANASLGYSGTRTFRWGASTRSASSDVNGNYAFDASEFDESAATNGTAGTLTVTSQPGYFQASTSISANPPFPITQNFSLTPTGATETITLATNPPALNITVDGAPYIGPQTFTWVPGNPHTIATMSPQPGPTGTQYNFANWNIGGAISQTIVTPAVNATYTANFTTQYLLTTGVSPSAGGSITTGGWINASNTVSIQANPNLGYQFSGFSGDLSGTTNPQNIVMNAPKAVTANFATLAAPAVGISVSSLLFGNWGVSTTSPARSSMLTNTGNATLSLTSIVASGDFVLITTSTSCPYSGGTVNPGSSCTIDVTFIPTALGTRVGAVTIADNAANSPQTVSLSGTGTTSVVALPGLVSWWPGDRNFNDIRGNNPGTNAGTVTFVPGEVGQAFHFDGSATSYISLSNSASFAPANNQVTIAAWVRPDFTASNRQDTIFSKRDGCGSNRSYLLSVSKAGLVPLGYSLGSIYWSASVAGDDAFTTGGFPVDRQFHLLAGTYDGVSMNLYLDGVLVAQKPHTGPIPATSEPAYIGLQGGCGDLTVADFDEVQFYSRALSQADISAIFNAGSAGVSRVAPVPYLAQPLVPTAITPGSTGFNLTVDGTGFVPGATVNWNGSALAATFVNSSQLTAAVPAAAIISAGTASVTVFNPTAGGVTSNVVYFEATNPTTSVSFSKSDYAAGSAAVSVTVGDFNGDGKLDLAVANLNSNSVSVLLGNGDGTFQAAVNYQTGTNPVSVTAGDFNGDGKLDLAVANLNSNNVSVLLGNGDGTFQAAVNYQAGTKPFSVTAGDFNADGKLDLAIANGNSNDVSVLLGNGDGTFQPAVNYPAADGPLSVMAGDFNGDGTLDLAVANNNSSNLSVLLGNGDGTFQPPVTYAVGVNPRSVAVADFNRDGKLDLVVANFGSNTLSVLLGNGDGTFQMPVTYDANSPNVPDHPQSVTVADFNGDGKLDLAVASTGATEVSVLLGNGDGTFQTAVNYAAGLSPQSITVGDFNGDGRMDLAVPNYGSNDVSILLQAAVVSLSTNNLTFASQSVGTTSVAQTVTLSNTGSAALTITSISVTGTNPGDFPETNNCVSPLAAGASCTINVSFKPSTATGESATLSIGDNALDSPQMVSVTGTGTAPSVPAVNLSSASLTFGNQGVGTTSATQSVTLTSSGTAALGIASIVVRGDFTLTTTASSCPYTGGVVNVGSSCTIDVTFAPATTGPRTGTVAVTDNAAGSPHIVTLSGTGVVPPGGLLAGIISTVAGDGFATGQLDGPGGDPRDDLGDGGPATSGSFYYTIGVAVDTVGNLYIADISNNRIRKVDQSGTITTVAGNGSAGYGGDGGPATSASLGSPYGVAVDATGNIFIADFDNNRIRKVDPSGTITTVAGNGTSGFSGDGGPATGASLADPGGVAVDGAGNLFIVDLGNQRIRRVDPSGTITTVAGNGTYGFSGDGGPATSASLAEENTNLFPRTPGGVTVDGAGNLFLSDLDNQRIRRVDPSGTITTVAGNGMYGYCRSCGDGGPATSARLDFPSGVAVDAFGNLYIADSYNHQIRKVDPSGTITTVAGTGIGTFGGDGGPPTAASLLYPFGVTIHAGDIYIADTVGQRIRKISGPPTVQLSTFNLTFGNQNLGSSSLAQTVSITNSSLGSLTISNIVTMGANANDFTFTSDLLPISLAPGATTTAHVTFAPTVAGSRTASLSINDNAGNSPQSIALTGTGSLATTATTITAPAITYGGAANVSVSVTSGQGTVTGNVSLTVDNASPLTQPLSGGSTIFTISGLGGGAHNLSASFAAQGNFAASAATGTLQVNQIQPTVTFTGAPPNAAYRSTFAVTATTNASNTANVTASGACSIAGRTVTMTSGTGTCSLIASWAADNNYLAASASQSTIATKIVPTVSFTGAPASAAYHSTFMVTTTTNASTTATLAGSGDCSIAGSTITMTSATGTCSLTASWAADNNYLAASATQSISATKANSTTALTSHTPNPSVVGQAVTISFTVTGSGTPTGSVTASDGTGDTCAGTVASGSCTLIATTAGAKTLTASYGGDSNFGSSASAGVTQTVNKANTTISITAQAPSPSVAMQPVTVNFRVAPVAPGSGTLTGNVTVSDGVGDTCTGTVATGNCSLSFAAAGARTLSAIYAGDGNFISSTSAGVPHNVTDFSIAASPASQSVKAGQKITYKMTLTPMSGFTGTVSLSCGALPLGSTCIASPSSITFTGSGPFNSTVTVQTGKSTPKANYTLPFNGTFGTGIPAAGGLTHTTNVSLTIN